MKEFSDDRLLKTCLLQIEEQLGWGSSDAWHNEVFSDLSEAIHVSTSILLSPTTLKRVWGKVSYGSSPSINTLNTLAQFAGYDNWLDFKNRRPPMRQKRIVEKRVVRGGILLAVATIVAMGGISQLSMVDIGSAIGPPANPDEIGFSSYPIAQGLPNSVLFDLDLKGIDSDSIYIQQYWDETKTIKLRRGQKQATGIYYYPGYFRAKLLVDGHIVKEHNLFIRSGGWLATVDYRPVPKYIPGDRLGDGPLRLPDETLLEIAGLEQPHYSGFHLVDDLRRVSADRFSLEVAVQNSYREKWAVCQTIKVLVLGTKGAVIVPFSIPGCVSDLGLMVNEVSLSGKEHDLSALGADFSSPRRIRLALQDRRLRIYLDGQFVFSVDYAEPLGELAGLRIRFLGAGEVHSLDLFDAEGAPVFEDGLNPLPGYSSSRGSGLETTD